MFPSSIPPQVFGLILLIHSPGHTSEGLTFVHLMCGLFIHLLCLLHVNSAYSTILNGDTMFCSEFFSPFPVDILSKFSHFLWVVQGFISHVSHVLWIHSFASSSLLCEQCCNECLFLEIGVWIQGFTLAKQVLCRLSYTFDPFCSGYFGR
jgi:hypothetical protein